MSATKAAVLAVRDVLRCSAATLASASFVLSGCAHFRQLEPTDHTAVIKAGPWGKVYRGGYVEIASVNGVDTGWRLRSDLQVGTGNQSALFYVYLCQNDIQHCKSVAEAQVGFAAQAHRTYQVHAREQVNGGNRFWVWVEDVADGKVVGGTPPDSDQNM